MHTRSIAAILALTLPASGQTPSPSQPFCADAIQDQALPGSCIVASSEPVPGALLPLGPYLWVDPGGDVGIGTQSPNALLDVAGTFLAAGRLALGNQGVLGGSPYWTHEADLSHRIDTFTPSYTLGLNSKVVYEPSYDLTGADENWLWSHVFWTEIPASNDRAVEALFGPTSTVLPRGTGTVNTVVGMGAVAENDAGHVNDQVGAAFGSWADHESTVGLNTWLYLSGGHYGSGNGSIASNYGLYVEQPYATSPLGNHYGIYLADQDFGKLDSYAIYSAGGTSYHAGDLGIGTPLPAAALDVNGDFVASGTKSFRQDHPVDPTREIWFVCLEGNEAGTYFRGTGRLHAGEAVIPVPEEFALVTAAPGLTVQVTALGDARLWVASKGLDHIVVRGSADVEFDYLVNGVRAGYETFEPLRAKPESRPTGQTLDPARDPARNPARRFPIGVPEGVR